VASETYDVFVSYSRADSRHAAEIDSVLRANGLRSFFDRRNLALGQPRVPALEQAIGAAKAVIVLIGPRGLGNTQQYERQLAIVRQSSDPAFPVVPVILPETRAADRPFDFLNLLTWIDFSPVAKVSEAPDEIARLLAAARGAPSPGDVVGSMPSGRRTPRSSSAAATRASPRALSASWCTKSVSTRL
jgi:hypothetical protein